MSKGNAKIIKPISALVQLSFLVKNIWPSAKITKSIVSNLVWTINYNTVGYAIWSVYKEKWVQILIIALCHKENNQYCLQCFIYKCQGIFIIDSKDPGGLLAEYCTFFLRWKKKATSNNGILILGNPRGLVQTMALPRKLQSTCSTIPSVPDFTDIN